MSKPILAGIAPQVVVKDARKTAEYYQNVLGFKLIGFFPAEVGTAYVMLERDGFRSTLAALMPMPTCILMTAYVAARPIF